jgi:glycine/D-amino acid oxidase-like deaminating enzyme/nitrite reductase/ring-hydroxylating ferredoxin subunit
MPEHDKDDASTISLWTDTAELPGFEPLQGALEADVCVVGAGITGLTAAYLLGKAGKRVVVLEAGPVAAGNTRKTTAHLSNEIDDRYSEVIRIRGVDDARLAHQSHTAAIAQIEAIVGEEGVDCGFERVDGYLFLGPDHDVRILEEELQAVHEIGWTAVELLPRVPVEGFDSGPCLRFPGQAQFHPLRYVEGLCRAIRRQGGQIYTHSHVDAITGGAPTTVTTSGGGRVQASATIVATCSPICDRVAIHTKQAPYTTYVVGLRVPAGRVPHALYWDTLDPYHYVRLHTIRGDNGGAHEVLIVGGEDHKTGQADDGERRFAALEGWARERFPGLGEVAYRWSGVVFETLDGLAHVGPDPEGMEHVFIATGDSGMGMTHGTLAAMLLRDQICGVENPWSAAYDPRRKPIRAAGEYIRENLNVARQYAHLLGPGEVSSVEAIARGTGAVIRRGLKRFAVYRDEGGQLHACSAVCTHLQGPVAWNSTEDTWDCPCHGSRFDPRGRVLGGPALHDLEPVDPGSL